MLETQAKYHHLIPKTYMSQWAHGKGTLNIEYIDNPGIVTQRNKENIAGITDFHSIKAGMPICTKSDTDRIFASLNGYIVEYQGRQINSTLEMNEKYYDFDKWSIKRTDGSSAGKKKIRNEIEQVKIRDIEFNWSQKYENQWSAEVKLIEKSILTSDTCQVKAFDRDYLMRFFTALDWRGFTSNEQFERTIQTFMEVLEDTKIPKGDRILPFLNTAGKEMRHCVLLKYYRQYLNDSGVVFQDAMINLQHTNFHFLIADGPTLFYTSDTPAFIHKRSDDKPIGLLPITPKILMAKGKSDGEHDVYYITHITDEDVKNYNNIIRTNATEFIILP